MGISLILPLIILLSFALAVAGLLTGAVLAPCRFATRRRSALCWNIIGLISFVGALYFLSSLPPRHPDDVQTIGETLTFILQLAAFFLTVEGIVYLLHWRWSLWRAGRNAPKA